MAIRSFSDMEKVINRSIMESQEELCDLLMESLENYIREDFYKDYNPKVYNRTYEFLNSVIGDTNKLKTIVRISPEFLRTSYPSAYEKNDPGYKEGSNEYNNLSTLRATGQKVAENARRGIHGIAYAQEGNEKRDFWKDFIDYCHEHAIYEYEDILKKHGLKNIEINDLDFMEF